MGGEERGNLRGPEEQGGEGVKKKGVLGGSPRGRQEKKDRHRMGREGVEVRVWR